jgi:hypothetical protein
MRFVFMNEVHCFPSMFRQCVVLNLTSSLYQLMSTPCEAPHCVSFSMLLTLSISEKKTLQYLIIRVLKAKSVTKFKLNLPANLSLAVIKFKETILFLSSDYNKN